MIDIVPRLLRNIQRDFDAGLNSSPKLLQLREMIDNGSATYQQANEYAVEVGEILSRSFETHVRYATLPDGKMYYNIAERVLNPTLSNNHMIVSQISAEVQENLNRSAGLGIRGIQPSVNQLRIDSL